MHIRSLPRHGHLLSYGAVMLGVLVALSTPVNGRAQSSAAERSAPATHTYNLPAMPLADAMAAIARISGKRVVLDDESAAGLSSAAVAGTLSVYQALEQALAGTQLKVRDAGSGVLWVAVPTRLDSVQVVAKRDQAETSFKADRSDTATRSGTSLMDVPASVTIITSRVLESQQTLSVRDALANVSGMSFKDTPQGSPSFSIRGFSQVSATVNGISDGSASLTNVFGVERIEVLKGPQAILAGAQSLGGGVNVVTKKPQAAPIRSLLLQYGSNADKTIAGDIGDAITDDKKLSYRLIAARSSASDSQGGFDGREETSLMPQLRWKDKTTDLIVGLSYGKQHAPTPLYTYARRDGYILPAPGLRQGTQGDGFDTEQRRAFYQLEHRLGDKVAFVSRMQRSLTELDLRLWSPFGLGYNRGAANDSPNGKATFAVGFTDQTVNVTSGDHYVLIEAETGPLTHKLSVGVNHARTAYRQMEWEGAFVSPMIYPPNASFSFPDLSLGTTPLAVGRQYTEQAGVYAQDLVSWGDWNLLANLRRTRFTTRTDYLYVPDNDFSAEPPAKVWSTTPGLGLIYNLTNETSLYASVAKGFYPSQSISCAGGLSEPTETTNKELGAKFDLFGGRLALTTSAFELAQSNSLVYDSIKRCYNTRDSQVTRGLELDVQGQPSRGWNVILNYTYSTVKDAGNSATVYAGQARHKANLWTTYQLPADEQWWKGLGVGFGFTATSQMNGSSSTTFPFVIPSQTRLDASLFYNRDKWSVTFGVKNLGDRLLYGVSSSNAYVPIQAGRTFALTVKRDFN